MAKTYKIRKFKSGERKDGSAFWNFALTVPTDIAEKLSDNMKFTCELTDDGLLFKPANNEEVELPDWVSNGSE